MDCQRAGWQFLENLQLNLNLNWNFAKVMNVGNSINFRWIFDEFSKKFWIISYPSGFTRNALTHFRYVAERGGEKVAQCKQYSVWFRCTSSYAYIVHVLDIQTDLDPDMVISESRNENKADEKILILSLLTKWKQCNKFHVDERIRPVSQSA